MLVVNGQELDIHKLITLPLCEGKDVRRMWNTEGIYSYNGHVGGLKQYYSCICDDCGAKWVESPVNAEELIAELGADVDWRLYTE